MVDQLGAADRCDLRQFRHGAEPAEPARALLYDHGGLVGVGGALQPFPRALLGRDGRVAGVYRTPELYPVARLPRRRRGDPLSRRTGGGRVRQRGCRSRLCRRGGDLPRRHRLRLHGLRIARPRRGARRPVACGRGVVRRGRGSRHAGDPPLVARKTARLRP